MNTIKHIIILYKTKHTKAKLTALDIQASLYEKNITSSLFPADVLDEQLIPEMGHTQAAVILGGDGTFIGSGRRFVGKNIPLLGINFGKLGFLLEFSPKNWPKAIEQMLSNQLFLQERPVLAWSIIHNNTILKKGFAINDVVIGRGALARLLPIKLTINDYSLGTILSDGILVSTPIGTSAYTVSAHGPLVHPDIPSLTLTSISTLFKDIPPLVLPASTNITLKPQPKTIEAFLTIDGQEGIELNSEEYVTVKCIQNNFFMYITPNYNYLQQVQNKSIILSHMDK